GTPAAKRSRHPWNRSPDSTLDSPVTRCWGKSGFMAGTSGYISSSRMCETPSMRSKLGPPARVTNPCASGFCGVSTPFVGSFANRVIWPAIALVPDKAEWRAQALADVEEWFQQFEPVLPPRVPLPPAASDGDPKE